MYNEDWQMKGYFWINLSVKQGGCLNMNMVSGLRLDLSSRLAPVSCKDPNCDTLQWKSKSVNISLLFLIPREWNIPAH